MLLFTQNGRCYWLKVYEIPEGSRASKGRAIQNVINIEPDDKIKTYLNVKNLKDEEYINNNYIVLGTKRGIIKKTSLEAYSRPRTNGVIAITVRDGDELLDAVLTNGHSEILLAGRNGRCCRFDESDARALGRTASGVRGINIEDDDEVIGMQLSCQGEYLLFVSENGYGKRTAMTEFKVQNRGGKGVKCYNIIEKTGNVVGMKAVNTENELLMITTEGIIIRICCEDISVLGRITSGVKLMNISEEHISVASITIVRMTEEETTENGIIKV
jgi:DNA gyrase subunit A